MKLENILEDLKIDNVVSVKKLTGGIRCDTYLLILDSNKKRVLQIYTDDIRYQCEKKIYIYKIIKEKINDMNNVDYIHIPNVVSFGSKDKYSYILTDYIEGNTLNNICNNNVDRIYEDLAQILSIMHSIDVGKYYGWILDGTLIQNNTIEEYLKAEVKRFEETLGNTLDESTASYVLDLAKSSLNKISNSKILRPQLVWYDINPNNIIVKNIDNEYRISGFIDPGAARFGIKEWDLAYVKVNLCKNDLEFDKILKKYKELRNEIDLEILEAFVNIVEIDELVLQINERKIDKIPRNSRLKDIFNELKIKYNGII